MALDDKELEEIRELLRPYNVRIVKKGIVCWLEKIKEPKIDPKLFKKKK